MKKILRTALLISGISFLLYSCSNGDYIANPNSNANGSINPLNPLTTSQFTWPALGKFSASINGAQWVADTAWFYLDTTGAFVITAYRDSMRQNFRLSLLETWAGSLYNMGYKQYNINGIYYVVDTSFKTGFDVYYSFLGNSGELYMQQNDTAIIQGRFYFQGVNNNNAIDNITNGYFNVHK